MIEPIDALASAKDPVHDAPHSSAARTRPGYRPETRRASWRAMQLLGADAMGIVAAAVLASIVYEAFSGTQLTMTPTMLALTVASFLVALAVCDAYRTAKGFVGPRPVNGRAVWHGLSLGVILALLAARAPFVSQADDLRLEHAALIGLLGLATIPAARYVVTAAAAPGPPRRVVIVGSGRLSFSIAGRLQRCSNVSVVGMVDDARKSSGLLGSEAQLSDICERYDVDDVVVAFSRTPTRETLELLRGLDEQVSIWVVPRMYELVSWRSAVEELHGIPLLDVAPAQSGRVARAGKRLFDVVVSSALLVLLSPLFAAVAVAIKVTSPGPVMFRQERSGLHGRPFRIFKFRTMCVDAEQQRAALTERNQVDGPIFKLKDDPRVTRVGHWLRQTSLDELPQLLNVVRGEMSLVGPRPFPIEESERITGWATIRFSVPPGMTGLWQVSGRNALTYDDLRHLDYIYTASWSFLWDLRILMQTPLSVMHRRGVI